jgi:hypothetical protein
MNYLPLFKKCLWAALALIVITACDPDPIQSPYDYTEGLWVANQGAFGSGNATVTWYHPAINASVEDMFSLANGAFAGDVLQSVTRYQGKAYLVLNGSNKLVEVDPTTFRESRVLTHVQLDKPNHLAVAEGFGYLSVWGPYDEYYSLTDSYVLQLDMATLEIVKKIETAPGVDKMLAIGSRVFAAVNNFGSGNQVVVINAADGEIEDTLELSDGPAAMVADAQNKLWVLCNGAWGATSGKLFRIHPVSLEIEQEIEISGKPGGQMAISPSGDVLVIRIGARVFVVPTDAQTLGDELFTVPGSPTITALGMDAQGKIYVADAKDYSSVGEVLIFNQEGTPVGSLSTGIVPTQILFW